MVGRAEVTANAQWIGKPYFPYTAVFFRLSARQSNLQNSSQPVDILLYAIRERTSSRIRRTALIVAGTEVFGHGTDAKRVAHHDRIDLMSRNTNPAKPLDLPGLVILLLPPFFWAGNFIVGRAMRDTVPPLALSFDRWLVAFFCLLPFAWCACRQDWRRYWQCRWHVLGVSLTGVAAFNVLVYFGLQSTSAANGMLLNSFIPLLIAGIGTVLYRQRLSSNQLWGILISFAGVLVIVSHGDWRALVSLRFSKGDAIIFLATVCWAFYTLWLKEIPADIDRRGLMLVQIVIALLFLLPLLLWEQSAGRQAIWNTQSLLAVAYIGIFPSVLAFMLYGAGIARVGAARASLFIHMIPVFGAILSLLLLHEPLHGYQFLGMGAIFLGVGCANRPVGNHA